MGKAIGYVLATIIVAGIAFAIIVGCVALGKLVF